MTLTSRTSLDSDVLLAGIHQPTTTMASSSIASQKITTPQPILTLNTPIPSQKQPNSAAPSRLIFSNFTEKSTKLENWNDAPELDLNCSLAGVGGRRRTGRTNRYRVGTQSVYIPSTSSKLNHGSPPQSGLISLENQPILIGDKLRPRQLRQPLPPPPRSYPASAIGGPPIQVSSTAIETAYTCTNTLEKRTLGEKPPATPPKSIFDFQSGHETNPIRHSITPVPSSSSVVSPISAQKNPISLSQFPNGIPSPTSPRTAPLSPLKKINKPLPSLPRPTMKTLSTPSQKNLASPIGIHMSSDSQHSDPVPGTCTTIYSLSPSLVSAETSGKSEESHTVKDIKPVFA